MTEAPIALQVSGVLRMVIRRQDETINSTSEFVGYTYLHVVTCLNVHVYTLFYFAQALITSSLHK